MVTPSCKVSASIRAGPQRGSRQDPLPGADHVAVAYRRLCGWAVKGLVSACCWAAQRQPRCHIWEQTKRPKPPRSGRLQQLRAPRAVHVSSARRRPCHPMVERRHTANARRARAFTQFPFDAVHAAVLRERANTREGLDTWSLRGERMTKTFVRNVGLSSADSVWCRRRRGRRFGAPRELRIFPDRDVRRWLAGGRPVAVRR
jgi:hypothetical protein